MPETKCAVVMLGPPGSGKTTLARSLTARGGICAIEVGNALEREIQGGTPLGRQIKPYKVAGDLVPSELVKQVLAAELERAQCAIVLFDGYPRNAAQIDTLFQLLKEHHLELCAALVLNLDRQVALERITGRRVCPACGALYNVYTQPPKQAGVCERCGGSLIQREDDRIEVVQNRLATYERDTIPVIEFFRREFGLLTLEESAAHAPDPLRDRIWRRLEAALSRAPAKAAPETGPSPRGIPLEPG